VQFSEREKVHKIEELSNKIEKYFFRNSEEKKEAESN
jgi:hypothetical protein